MYTIILDYLESWNRALRFFIDMLIYKVFISPNIYIYMYT